MTANARPSMDLGFRFTPFFIKKATLRRRMIVMAIAIGTNPRTAIMLNTTTSEVASFEDEEFIRSQYKAEVVGLVRSSGKSVGQVARELDLTETGSGPG